MLYTIRNECTGTRLILGQLCFGSCYFAKIASYNTKWDWMSLKNFGILCFHLKDEDMEAVLAGESRNLL